MAGYADLYGLTSDSGLRNRVTVACVIAANNVIGETPEPANHAARVNWAAETFKNPTAMGRSMLNAVLAANAGLTVAQIQSATDAGIQTAVDSAVDTFADAMAAGG